MSELEHQAANKQTQDIPRWLQNIVDWGSDRLNPLLVRNIRQNLRNRTFLSFFFLMLGIGAIAGLMVATSPQAGSSRSDSGWELFVVLAWVWGAGVIIVQSLSAFRAVITERQDDTWDLVELSTLEPKHILRGLLYTALVQGIMFTAALAPFMVMAYMLRGLDVWVIIITFVSIPAMSVCSCTANIFCACLTNKKSSRAVISLFALGLTLFCYFYCLVGITSTYFIREFVEEISRFSSEIATFLLIGFNCFILFNIMMILFSSSLLKHKAANRSTGPRLIWFISYINISTLILFAPTMAGGSWDLSIFYAIAVIGSYAAVALGLFSITEHNRLSPRQIRDLNHPNRFLRALMPILGPGAARGRISFLAMALMPLIFATIGYTAISTGKRLDRLFHLTWATLAMASFILVVADALYRGPFKRFFDTPALRRAFVLTFFAVVNIIPAILVFMLQKNFNQSDVFEMLTPIYCVFEIADNPHRNQVAAIILAVLGGLSVAKMIYDIVCNYNPRLLRVVAGETDHNPRGPRLMPQWDRAQVHAAVQQLRLASDPRRIRHGHGLRMGQGPGASLEFHDYRNYVMGDDLRMIDWGVYARSDQLVLRRHRQEISPRVEIILDASASMGIDDRKWKLAAGLSALFMALTQNDGARAALWDLWRSIATRSKITLGSRSRTGTSNWSHWSAAPLS